MLWCKTKYDVRRVSDQSNKTSTLKIFFVVKKIYWLPKKITIFNTSFFTGIHPMVNFSKYGIILLNKRGPCQGKASFIWLNILKWEFSKYWQVKTMQIALRRSHNYKQPYV